MPAGKYRIQLKSGRQELLVWQNFPATSLVQVVAGEVSKVPLRVRRGGFIRLNLRPPFGDPIEIWKGFSVATDHPKQARQPSSLAIVLCKYPATMIHMPEPRVGVPGLCTTAFEPGKHDLTIKADGYREVHVPALVTAGEISEVEVFMQRK